jgi:hypothetical protein
MYTVVPSQKKWSCNLQNLSSRNGHSQKVLMTVPSTNEPRYQNTPVIPVPAHPCDQGVTMFYAVKTPSLNYTLPQLPSQLFSAHAAIVIACQRKAVRQW